jgi:hypothetical protein
MRRFGRRLPGVLGAALLLFAQRARCAAAMRRRAAADIVRRGLVYERPPLNFPKTARAASTCLSWFTRFVLSARNSATMVDNPRRFAMREILTPCLCIAFISNRVETSQRYCPAYGWVIGRGGGVVMSCDTPLVRQDYGAESCWEPSY